MKWEDYKTEFDFDGNGLDIYVLGTSVSDWQILVDFIRASVYEYSFFDGVEAGILPIRVDKMFEPEYDFTPLLSIKVGSVILNCHFFTGREIDFDFDPREITSEFQAAQVFTFIHQIGKLLNKEVIVTPSNYQSYVIFKFSPCIGQIQHISRRM